MKKELKELMELKGEEIKSANIKRVIPELLTVVCDLMSESDIVLETDATFIYKGTEKNVPFDLTHEEINEIKGNVTIGIEVSND